MLVQISESVLLQSGGIGIMARPPGVNRLEDEIDSLTISKTLEVVRLPS